MNRTTYALYEKDYVYYQHTFTKDTEDYIYNMHTHDCLELTLLQEGKGKYLVEGKSYPIKNNSFVISRRGCVHCIKIDKGSAEHRRRILLDPSSLNVDLDSLVGEEINVVNFEDNSIVLQLFDKLDYYYKNLPNDVFEHLLFNIIEEILYNIKINNQDRKHKENPFITKALNLIEENLTEPIVLDKLCQELYVSKSYLHRTFVDYLHISPKRFINLKRLGMAQQRILSGERPTDAAFKCGFSDYSSFYRAYKKHFGYSPSLQKERNIGFDDLY